MRWIWMGLLFFMMSTTWGTAAEQAPVVAVFEIQAKRTKLSKIQIGVLTELLASELGVGGVFKIMAPGDIQQVLQFQARDSYKKCFDEQCQIELGRQLPANKLLSASIIRIGTQCRVAASLYDLKRQTTDIVTKESCACDEDSLAKAVEEVASKVRQWHLAENEKKPEVPRQNITTDSPGQNLTQDSSKPEVTTDTPKHPIKPPEEKVGPVALDNTKNLARNNSPGNYLHPNPPHPFESSSGWGGGSQPAEIVDGERGCPGGWACGLAFTGGPKGWGGESCGVRQATIVLGQAQWVAGVAITHHGKEHAPRRYQIQLFEAFGWKTVLTVDNRTASACELPNGDCTITDTFAPALANRVRFEFNNCPEMNESLIDGTEIEHGWLYEFEVYGPSKI